MNDNWKTPEYILDLVKQVFGEIYFDPCPLNSEFNGLIGGWMCRSFINPPYSRGSLELWVKKGIQEYLKHEIDQIWLINYGCTNNRVELKKHASAICDLYKRISFIDPVTNLHGKENNRDSVIYYLGKNKYKFGSVFKKIGEVFIKPKNVLRGR